MEYTKNLKEIRKKLGITQAEMADVLGYKSKAGYSELERGNVKVTLEQAKKISEVFNLSINDIFFN